MNGAAPALQGPGLESLARQYMEVQSIIRRWARRYDERLLDQLIYMPEVTADEFDRADWMRDWTRDLTQHLNGLSGVLDKAAAHAAARKIKDTKIQPETTADAAQQLQRLVPKRFL